jgi:para-nitrobenzyl esterase
VRLRRIVKSALPALGFISAVLVVLSVWSGGCSGSGLEEVTLTSGPITGSVEEAPGGNIWTFKGIPYAAPPVGDLRWKPPQPVEPWTEPLACVEPGPACPQPGQADAPYLDLLSVGDTAEDCLYLNVWSPAESPEERLPVMVWIHGGSFETGSGAMAVYDGLGLAARGVVVVTINYRLGPFGFLAHPALSGESPEGVSGNYGLLDQIAALEWVRDNIAGFGGDPGNVTVFGESAGAISILDLLVSPLAEGLFHRAIAQSGILLDYGFGVSTTGNLAQAEAAGEDFAERLGVDSGGEGGDVLARMRAKTADELLAVMAEVAAESRLLDQGLNWKPVADGYVLPDYPTRLWAAGQRHDVPLLIGSNADEGNIFLAGLDVAPEDYETQMRNIFGDYAEEALALYPASDEEGTRVGLSRMLTEVGFASTARFAAQEMSGEMASASDTAGPTPAYLYQFTRVPMKTLLGDLGAFHGLEIPYVFGTVDLFAALGMIEQADRDLAETIMGYWIRFAATGDPNGDGAPEWPRYQAEADRHLELGDTIQSGSGLYREACDLADRVRGVR